MNLRAVCSLENIRTCDKIWVWEQRFFREELEKKGHLMDFYGPSSIVVLTELTFFDKISAWEYGKFMKNKNKKQTWEHFVFKRVDVFLTKRGDESYFFLENGRFLIKYGHQSSNFSWEIGKKGILLTFLAHNRV